MNDKKIKQFLDEEEKRSAPAYVIKLSCHPDICVSIEKTGDQIIRCPQCNKANVVTWGYRKTIKHANSNRTLDR